MGHWRLTFEVEVLEDMCVSSGAGRLGITDYRQIVDRNGWPIVYFHTVKGCLKDTIGEELKRRRQIDSDKTVALEKLVGQLGREGNGRSEYQFSVMATFPKTANPFLRHLLMRNTSGPLRPARSTVAVRTKHRFEVVNS